MLKASIALKKLMLLGILVCLPFLISCGIAGHTYNAINNRLSKDEAAEAQPTQNDYLRPSQQYSFWQSKPVVNRTETEPAFAVEKAHEPGRLDDLDDLMRPQ